MCRGVPGMSSVMIGAVPALCEHAPFVVGGSSSCDKQPHPQGPPYVACSSPRKGRLVSLTWICLPSHRLCLAAGPLLAHLLGLPPDKTLLTCCADNPQPLGGGT